MEERIKIEEEVNKQVIQEESSRLNKLREEKDKKLKKKENELAIIIKNIELQTKENVDNYLKQLEKNAEKNVEEAKRKLLENQKKEEEEMKMQRTRLEKERDEILQELRKSASMTSYEPLDSQKIQQADVDYICKQLTLNHPDLQTLNLKRKNLTAENVEKIAKALELNTTVTKLNLEHNGFGDKPLTALKNMIIKNRSIET